MLVCLCACFWIAQYYNLINVTFILATQVGIVVVCLGFFTSLINTLIRGAPLTDVSHQHI